jgi:hypothetical protein
MKSSIDAFSQWLSQTSFSVAIQEAGFVVPATQTLHILAIAALASSALFLSVRVLASGRLDASSRDTDRRFLPVVWWALAVLFVSGVVLIVAEPARALLNPAFWLKMALLSAASLLYGIYQWPLRRNADFWRASVPRWRVTRTCAALSLALWAGVILSGRFIAYVQAS